MGYALDSDEGKAMVQAFEKWLSDYTQDCLEAVRYSEDDSQYGDAANPDQHHIPYLEAIKVDVVFDYYDENDITEPAYQINLEFWIDCDGPKDADIFKEYKREAE